MEQVQTNLDLASRALDDGRDMVETIGKLEKEKHLLKYIVGLINKELSSNTTISYKTEIEGLDGMTINDILGTVVEVKEEPTPKPSRRAVINNVGSRILDL